MAMKLSIGKIGFEALIFIVAMVLVAVTSFVPSSVAAYASTITIILLILGSIAAVVAVSSKERVPLMISGLAIATISSAFILAPQFGGYIDVFFANLLIFVGPMTILTALVTVWETKN